MPHILIKKPFSPKRGRKGKASAVPPQFAGNSTPAHSMPLYGAALYRAQPCRSTFPVGKPGISSTINPGDIQRRATERAFSLRRLILCVTGFTPIYFQRSGGLLLPDGEILNFGRIISPILQNINCYNDKKINIS